VCSRAVVLPPFLGALCGTDSQGYTAPAHQGATDSPSLLALAEGGMMMDDPRVKRQRTEDVKPNTDLLSKVSSSSRGGRGSRQGHLLCLLALSKWAAAASEAYNESGCCCACRTRARPCWRRLTRTRSSCTAASWRTQRDRRPPSSLQPQQQPIPAMPAASARRPS
jgi:hypothetical protein